VEIKPLAQMLEDLLYDASDDGLEVCLAEAVCDDGSDWDSVRAEYQQRYRRAVEVVCELRGEPQFVGSRHDPGFPTWLVADQATCWSDAAGIVYVGLRDGALTICMVGGGHPHPVKREAITLLPPAD
jgi:hypothetical protein